MKKNSKNDKGRGARIPAGEARGGQHAYHMQQQQKAAATFRNFPKLCKSVDPVVVVAGEEENGSGKKSSSARVNGLGSKDNKRKACSNASMDTIPRCPKMKKKNSTGGSSSSSSSEDEQASSRCSESISLSTDDCSTTETESSAAGEGRGKKMIFTGTTSGLFKIKYRCAETKVGENVWHTISQQEVRVMCIHTQKKQAWKEGWD